MIGPEILPAIARAFENRKSKGHDRIVDFPPIPHPPGQYLLYWAPDFDGQFLPNFPWLTDADLEFGPDLHARIDLNTAGPAAALQLWWSDGDRERLGWCCRLDEAAIVSRFSAVLEDLFAATGLDWSRLERLIPPLETEIHDDPSARRT